MEKTLKINVPDGYEIDKEKSTFWEYLYLRRRMMMLLLCGIRNYSGVEICADGEHFIVDSNPMLS